MLLKLGKFSSLVFLGALVSSSLEAVTLGVDVGLHDFIVSDIKNDTPLDGVSSGTSHTLGVNAALWVQHTTEKNINILAKAEGFLDKDNDHLDPDHIPVWFHFVIDVDGDIDTINNYNTIKWYIYMDNKQNTVSCIEREIRQHVGIGWQHQKNNLTLALNAYAGFYYIEIDDDTPGKRGYNRLELDDGEASNVFEFEFDYKFNQLWSFAGSLRRYSANAGFEELETNYDFLLTYNASDIVSEDSTLNLKVKYTKYNFDRFNIHELNMLPWDNDTLVQAYLSIPFKNPF